jgi:MFS family permease
MSREQWPELQRRTLRVLVAGQVIAAASLASAVTVGAYVIQDMLGQETPWGGVATATVTTGTAFMAQMLSRFMARGGRRRGFVVGYGLAISGGLVSAVGVQTGWLPLFLAGLFLYGSGQAANLLARYAATDLAEAEQRGRAMSRILFASTFGAIFGPLLVVPAQHLGQDLFGWKKYTGPWVFAACFFVVALLNVWIRLRPDPLEVSGGLNRQAAAGVVSPRFRESLQIIVSTSGGRIALLAMVVSQATMVAVMTMTPVHMKAHGHESASPFVISLHIAGMYAFSPLVGRFSDSKGRLHTVTVGAALLIGATILAALAGESDIMLFPALWLLGIGWSFGLIGGSSLLIDSVPVGSRVQVQGSADLLMSLCGGLAGFSSGFVRKAVGFHMLSNIAAALALVLVVAVLRHQGGLRSFAVAASGQPVGSEISIDGDDQQGRPVGS